jgi:uncharacterized cupin superfamily protein
MANTYSDSKQSKRAIGYKAAEAFKKFALVSAHAKRIKQIETANTAGNLTLRPIEPSWVIEGQPESRSNVLSQSKDGQACTIVWECTAGKFNWHYDFDETILILEGSIVIESDDMPATRYGVGDVIFFKYGAHAKWHVENYVRKLAFCRKTDPVWLAFPTRVLRKLHRLYKGMMTTGGRQATSLADSS